ncbi:hypothetical protein GUITHDRAFT_131760 [Guillardia theta CCMP2712]|uniref:Uncharacterized protein n=1 Tax=Guillardia theta (strain CCMP2712) TaxID=905079 RepID=L1K2B9_GUITC|nr:hypothetical protein GUITHDRAFT_131760 [Guillardia theta CCMP2712]EKX54727.1 hypothetical protein GUITHDRAFT_131760 [Guillardia theta CCMP2712]|eukprot:XP_005841707.1 hypothetical protein GUITHDRAFT_131760 [Guillardia theta CCMP2712]
MEIERNARAECDPHSLSWMDEQGNFFVTSSEDGFTKLWSISDASSITLRGHIRRVVSCAFSPKGDMVATGSMDSTIKLWNTGDGSCLVTLEGHEELVSCVHFDSKGRFLLSGSYDGTMKRWRVMDGRCAFTYQDFSNNVVCIALKQDDSTQNEFVACGSGKGTIFVLTTGQKSGRNKLKGHKGAIKQLAFHPVRAQMLCSFADDSSFRLWDCNSSSCVQLVDGDLGRILGFRLLPRTGHLLFASVDTSKEKKKSSTSRFALGTLRYLASSLSGVGSEDHQKNGSCLSLVLVGFANNNLYADTLAIKRLPGGHVDKVHGVFFANESDYFSTVRSSARWS